MIKVSAEILQSRLSTHYYYYYYFFPPNKNFLETYTKVGKKNGFETDFLFPFLTSLASQYLNLKAGFKDILLILFCV